jgi:hypothetical protein
MWRKLSIIGIEMKSPFSAAATASAISENQAAASAAASGGGWSAKMAAAGEAWLKSFISMAAWR